MSRIMRTWLMGLAMLVLASAVQGQESGFSGLARLDTAQSTISDTRHGLEVTLTLSQGVPYRVFTLDDPARLVMDFREVDWNGAQSGALITGARALGLRLGQIRPGWSRMVVDLAGPHMLEEAGLRIDRQSGAARLQVRLGREDAEGFAASAGTPDVPGWDLPAAVSAPVAPRADDGVFRVVLDPGHGGIDPGAEVDGTQEKDLMLIFARELREVLLRTGGFDVVLTRDADEFVSLERRVALAHRAGADVFLSLHADALSGARARGASVYTLSDSASDAASAALAERHNRADILAGVDLSGKDDVVADVLMDLARMETQPRSEHLARVFLEGFRAAGLPLLSRPKRHAGFSVLKAPDIPSVLIELGFLSNPRDLKNLRDAEWRAQVAQAVSDALGLWHDADAARAGLVRQ
ncbi:N-acetylmuramoyl-L-alanine amidase AmiA precursor [Roseovarius tolerans]|uniref:N-acetylmuramoyl-L-alanine amidase n=1 Tax=Roseovarius tolerans TaxID=74031 RepID=A0A0L6CYB4_9RHOB|nr:N-acetylmuramoyl-L-alanine amidase [Roseovarius tolerans]KNX42448.1 N-acetylmuramoyl-L-alanine amidase AmiA precursor [Roseovarius tolerans]